MGAPSATNIEMPSDHVAFVQGGSGQLDIMFSHAAPAGQFIPGPDAILSPNSKLFIKEQGHGFYQQGIPGISENIEETAVWLDRFIRRVQPASVRMFGFSSGASGAMIYGHLLGADAVYAFGGEIRLGHPKYRSHQWSTAKSYHPIYGNMRHYLQGLGRRLCLVYSAYEPMEYKSIGEAMDGGARRLLFTPSLHPGGGCVNGDLWQATTPLSADSGVVTPLYPFRNSRAEIDQIRQAYELTIDADYGAAQGLFIALYGRDPRNFGILAHIGLQHILLGRPDSGMAALEKAIGGIMAWEDDITARQLKTIIRGYYWKNQNHVRLLEESFAAAWDIAAADLLA